METKLFNSTYEAQKEKFTGICRLVKSTTMIGRNVWMVNGIRHRLDGPAVLYDDGECYYWLDGIATDPVKYWQDPSVLSTILNRILNL